MPDGKKKVVFFYRWAHYSCLIVAGAYLLLRLLIKRFGNPRLQNMFSNIRKNSPRLDESREDDQIRTFMEYFKENIETHGDFYQKYLLNHIYCFGISLLNFWFLNFVLQGEFTRLILEVFPFHRDSVNFRDPLSVIFPPFVNCTIGHGSKMLNKREDEIHCHLTLMEMLEKVFVFAWIFMVSALIIGGINVIFLLCLPFHKNFLLKTKESSPLFKKLSRVLARNLSFGDTFLLFMVKSHLTANEFCKILIEILKYLQYDPIAKEK
ncbi:Innexin inx4 [Armadillidium vulgare]|nr:Innexin inx4 [Armadillidium vulgare]